VNYIIVCDQCLCGCDAINGVFNLLNVDFRVLIDLCKMNFCMSFFVVFTHYT